MCALCVSEQIAEALPSIIDELQVQLEAPPSPIASITFGFRVAKRFYKVKPPMNNLVNC